MPKKRYYLPVLLVYTITSFTFVLIFAQLFYQNKKNEIFEKSAIMLRDQAYGIHHFNKNDIEYNRDGFLNYNIAIFDRFNQKFIQADFIPDFNYLRELKNQQEKTKKNKDKKNFSDFISNNQTQNLSKIKPKTRNFPQRIFGETYFVYDKEFAYYVLTRDNMIILRTNEPIKEMTKILNMLCLICIIMFFIISLLAYFIVRISYKPLLTHINGLNTFITDTTHEINTPLSVILISVEMFDKNPQKYLNNIKIASKNLSMLYSDLSANLKVMPLSIEKIDLAQLLTQRVEFFTLLAQKKQLNFNLNLNKVELQSDVFRMTKIIDNLISNAIKYSFNNEIITIILEDSTLTISQKGIVIPAEKIHKIYDKYTRFDSTNGGFGIGLSLVKSYCNELKYKISCTSNPDKTTFIIKFK